MLPLQGFRVNLRSSGSDQYPPSMMLSLLIYCYATGRMGSRTIEAATYTDVLCSEDSPTGFPPSLRERKQTGLAGNPATAGHACPTTAEQSVLASWLP